jgi:hypothetical protein
MVAELGYLCLPLCSCSCLCCSLLIKRLYISAFPVPDFPGIPGFLSFPFPGETHGNCRKYKITLFSYKSGHFRVLCLFRLLMKQTYFPGSREFPGNATYNTLFREITCQCNGKAWDGIHQYFYNFSIFFLSFF